MTTAADIDRRFYETAKKELARLGLSPIELFQRHPNLSKKSVAKLIGNGVTSRGLTMTLFEDAMQRLSVRTVTQDLLYRDLLDKFPDGWFEEESIRAAVKISGWHYDVLQFAPEYEENATAILKALTTTNKPQMGWKPTSRDDELLHMLFETYWPSSQKEEK